MTNENRKIGEKPENWIEGHVRYQAIGVGELGGNYIFEISKNNNRARITSLRYNPDKDVLEENLTIDLSKNFNIGWDTNEEIERTLLLQLGIKIGKENRKTQI